MQYSTSTYELLTNFYFVLFIEKFAGIFKHQPNAFSHEFCTKFSFVSFKTTPFDTNALKLSLFHIKNCKIDIILGKCRGNWEKWIIKWLTQKMLWESKICQWKQIWRNGLVFSSAFAFDMCKPYGVCFGLHFISSGILNIATQYLMQTRAWII